MSRIEKIIISVIISVCVIIFMQNVTFAGWVNSGGFKRADKNYKNYNFDTRVYGSVNNRLYVTDNIFINWPTDTNPENRKFGSTYPKLDQNVGVLCLQHGKTAGTTKKPKIQKNIKISGTQRYFELSPKNDGYDYAAARIAYILTFTSMDNPSVGNRKTNGTQGALWNRIKSYYNAFPGEVDEDFSDLVDGNTAYNEWTKVNSAIRIDNEATDYMSMLSGGIKDTSLTTSGCQWKNSGNNYIIGPFTVSYMSYTGANSGKTFAGIEKKEECKLKKSNGQEVSQNSWYFSDSNGSGIGIPKSGSTFYITVSKQAMGGSGGSLTISAKRINAVAEWWTMKCKSDDQKRLYLVYGERKWISKSATISFSPPSLTINKVDKDSRKRYRWNGICNKKFFRILHG